MPWSEVMCKGTPCLEKTWRTNSLASIGDVMVSTVGIKINYLVRQSMMTSIVLKPSDIGSFSMKSMDIVLGLEVVLRVHKDSVSVTLSAYKWCMI